MEDTVEPALDPLAAAGAPSFMEQYGLWLGIGGGVLLLAIIIVVVMLMKKGKGDEDEDSGRSRKSKSKSKSKRKGGRNVQPAAGLWFWATLSFFTLGIFIAVLVLQVKEYQHYLNPQPGVENSRSVWPNALRYTGTW